MALWIVMPIHAKEGRVNLVGTHPSQIQPGGGSVHEARAAPYAVALPAAGGDHAPIFQARATKQEPSINRARRRFVRAVPVADLHQARIH